MMSPGALVPVTAKVTCPGLAAVGVSGAFRLGAATEPELGQDDETGASTGGGGGGSVSDVSSSLGTVEDADVAGPDAASRFPFDMTTTIVIATMAMKATPSVPANASRSPRCHHGFSTDDRSGRPSSLTGAVCILGSECTGGSGPGPLPLNVAGVAGTRCAGGTSIRALSRSPVMAWSTSAYKSLRLANRSRMSCAPCQWLHH